MTRVSNNAEALRDFAIYENHRSRMRSVNALHPSKRSSYLTASRETLSCSRFAVRSVSAALILTRRSLSRPQGGCYSGRQKSYGYVTPSTQVSSGPCRSKERRFPNRRRAATSRGAKAPPTLSRPQGGCYSSVTPDSSGHRPPAPGPAPEVHECAKAQGRDPIPIRHRLHLRGLRGVPSRSTCRAMAR